MLIGFFWIFTNLHKILFLQKLILLEVVTLFIQAPILYFGVCQDNFLKFFISAPIIVFLSLIGYEIGRFTSGKDWWEASISASKIVALIVFASLMLEIFLPSIFSESILIYHQRGLHSGLYSEPSQLAYLAFPCISILLCSKIKKDRNIGWIFLAVLIALSPSTTFLLILFIWIAFRLIYQKRILIILALILIIPGSLLSLGISSEIAIIANIIDRIDGVFISNIDTTNISSMIYLQGFQDGIANLMRTNGFGLGFNMMGCTPLPDVPARDSLYILDPALQELNNSDGSFLASKIMSEFGLFGLFSIILIGIFFMKQFKQLIILQKKNSLREMQLFVIFSLIEIIFIRSSGYFSGTVFLFFMMIGGLKRSDSQNLKTSPIF